MDLKETQYSPAQKLLAYSVHLLTASGLLAGFLAILAINDQDWRTAMFWLVVSLIIDGIDGTFARLFRVREVLPSMDGKTIDYIVDFATYAIIPAYFIFKADLISEEWNLITAFIILLVSAIYYGKAGMVSEDYYFIGFPVLWNLIVFYLIFIVQFPQWGNLTAILIFVVLHLIPIKVPYPSRTEKWRGLNIIMSVVFIASMVLAIYFYPQKIFWVSAGAIISFLYFALVTITESLKMLRE